MIDIINTCSQIAELFEDGNLHLGKWEQYMNSIYDNSAYMLKEDLEEYFVSGHYTFEKDFLPMINAVCKNPALELLQDSFAAVTHDLNGKIKKSFHNELNMDIVLYLGLGNSAGRMANINGRDTILLGIEKILELKWYGIDALRGLIYHELGHAYHKQYGSLNQDSSDNQKNFVWHLFTEGIAMYFEQVLADDLTYFHQDKSGWRAWCDAHFQQILSDFHRDLPGMTRMNQRYFGDWADYYGYGDVGYYLGTRFVHWLVGEYDFEQLIHLDIDGVYNLYLNFTAAQGDLAEHTDNFAGQL